MLEPEAKQHTAEIRHGADLINETVRRLVSVVRCTHIKRAIETAEPNLHLNFWRVIVGTLLDCAVLDWCTIFGGDGEEPHWKKIVPDDEHAAFRSELLQRTGLTETEWHALWKEMKTYRDNHLAHKGERRPGDVYPHLSHALTSAEYYYEWLSNKGLLEGLPPSLSAYAKHFAELAHEVARAALGATEGIPERVDGRAPVP